MRLINRLELHDSAKNSHKYYEFNQDADGSIVIFWGRCLGHDSNGGQRREDREIAMKLLDQKLRKGYRVVK